MDEGSESEEHFFEAESDNLPVVVTSEKYAGNDDNLGLILLPFCTWGLYTIMAAPGDLNDAARLCYVLKRIAP